MEQGSGLRTQLQKVIDPNFRRTVVDEETGEETVLSDQELDMLFRIQEGKYYSSNVGEEMDLTDLYPYDSRFPVINLPEPKSRFIPSKWEAKKVIELVRKIRRGDYDHKIPEKPDVYNLWTDDTDPAEWEARSKRLPPPPIKLPDHAESYNPPPEYLLTPEEQKEWEAANPYDRKYPFLPQMYAAMRQVPGYKDFIKERFQRDLDLYLFPASSRRSFTSTLRICPSCPTRRICCLPQVMTLEFFGHGAAITALSVDPTGQYIASGSRDRTVRVWDIPTGRCLRLLRLEADAEAVAWNPVHPIIAIAAGKKLLLYTPGLTEEATEACIALVVAPLAPGAMTMTLQSGYTWHRADTLPTRDGVVMDIAHPKPITQLCWHPKGDYFAAVSSDTSSSTVIIHQLSRRRSQLPFTKKRLVMCVLFHPTKPLFFVASRTAVQVFDLMKQQLVKKLRPSAKWITSMALHPTGSHLIVGSADSRLAWFDLEAKDTPYKILRYPGLALRQVCFHQTQPLFASGADNGTLHVFHGRVYTDMETDPLLVPVKVLRPPPSSMVPVEQPEEEVEEEVDEDGEKKAARRKVITPDVRSCVFHPRQPWIFSGSADGVIRLFV
ncbi:putative Ribosome biogenesis protein BOP1 [Paratrimastix pyriformis]|uniref:Ribosome biogenesis protein BOP1 n=1 Tax=Paratrimastix pyriformis TaxID=342808 RepID=A0ABQ8UIA5_9EUKA|nr:putative Ribosome biogenesis protein BOP1 [Paratrimastix pyriformis]